MNRILAGLLAGVAMVLFAFPASAMETFVGKDLVGRELPMVIKGETTPEEFQSGATWGRILRLQSPSGFYDLGIDEQGNFFINTPSDSKDSHAFMISQAGVVTTSSEPHTVVPQSTQTLMDCERNEESFGFELKDFPIIHQNQALLNLSVKFRFIPEVADDISLYPDFVPMAEDIQSFLESYPNETDYWEILTKNLVNFLMDKYTSIASLRLKVDVNPTTPRARYERYSVVTVTRPGQCPLIAQPV